MKEHLKSPQSFLNWIFQKKQAKHPKFSLRAWAKRLQIGPSTLSRILSGQRHVSYKLAVAISQNLEIQNTEKFIFILIVLKANSTQDFEKQFYQEYLSELVAKGADFSLDEPPTCAPEK